MALTTATLAEYVHADATGEAAFLASCVSEAQELVGRYVGTRTVPPATLDRALLEVAADLYYRRSTRNGVADFEGVEGLAPVRVNRDPLAAAYPILRPFVGGGFA